MIEFMINSVLENELHFSQLYSFDITKKIQFSSCHNVTPHKFAFSSQKIFSRVLLLQNGSVGGPSCLVYHLECKQSHRLAAGSQQLYPDYSKQQVESNS